MINRVYFFLNITRMSGKWKLIVFFRVVRYHSALTLGIDYSEARHALEFIRICNLDTLSSQNFTRNIGIIEYKLRYVYLERKFRLIFYLSNNTHVTNRIHQNFDRYSFSYIRIKLFIIRYI